MRLLLSIVGVTLLGGAIGAIAGWIFNPSPVPVEEADMAFVNSVGPILFGAIGLTLGFIVGGGTLARQFALRAERENALERTI